MTDEQTSATGKLISLASSVDFGTRYYTYCARFDARGPEIPFDTQVEALEETGRTFRFQKSEGFFAWRDSTAPDGCELGINLILKYAKLEWVLAFKTPTAKLGRPLNLLAFQVKRLTLPTFSPESPNPMARAANKSDLAEAIEVGLSLYDSLAGEIAKTKWT